jgi:hypothetical protein
MAYHVEQSCWQTRWIASLLVIFGVLALMLAVVGLYGVVSKYPISLKTESVTGVARR